MKNNFEHAHVVENIRFARAQKTRRYSLTLSSNSALNIVSIFGEHPIGTRWYSKSCDFQIFLSATVAVTRLQTFFGD